MDYKKEYNERKAAVIELLRGCINFYTGLEKAEQVSTLEDLESNVKTDVSRLWSWGSLVRGNRLSSTR